jgi:hypothetical protein
LSTQPAVGPRGELRPDSAFAEKVLRLAAARHSIVLLATAWVGGAALLFNRLNQGWMHHDDGSMAHSAQRVLDGEFPHRDFADLYTGGLAFLDAGIFWLLGEDLVWLRLPVFLLFLLYIPCYYVLARRFVSPLGAFGATLFAIAWSVPAYPAPMPTWYVLYFAVFGAYGVMRYFEGGGKGWLLAAGVLGGLSISFKIVGIWYVMAVLLALAFARDKGPNTTTIRLPAPLRYRFVAGGMAIGTLALVVAVLREKLGAAALGGLVIPIAIVCTVLVLLSRRGAIGVGPQSLHALIGDASVFLAGVIAPLAVLVVPYAASGSIDALIDGVLIAPQTRFEFAYRSMPGPATLVWAAPVVAYLVARAFIPEPRRRRADLTAGGTVAGVVVGLWVIDGPIVAYPVVWKTAQALGPFVVALGALALLRRDSSPERGPSRDMVVLVVLMAGLMSLIQFPFSAPLYFCYVAPLVFLAAVAALSHAGLVRGAFPAVLLVVLVLFGFRFIDHQSFWSLGEVYRPDPHTKLLNAGRASVRAIPSEAAGYRRIVRLIRQHARGDFIYAGPDAPQVYFLADKRNPTRSVLDFLDVSDSARGRRLVELLGARRVNVIVINHNPLQSARHPSVVIRRLRHLYPRGERVGYFEVRWRGSPDEITVSGANP